MIIKLLITYQILIVNLSLTHMLAKKKYPAWVTFGVLFLFTLILSIGLYFTSTLYAGEKPTAWFILTGSFYIVPLYLLYNIKLRELITIMIYCWTYTMALSAITVGVGNLLYVFKENVTILLTQTILFAITFSWILRFTKNKFMVILHNASDSTSDLLILLGVSLFGVVSGTRYFVHPEENIYYLLVFLLIIIIITSYNLLFRNVQSHIHLDSANKIVYHDTLTGIGNRYSLFQDMVNYISKNREFTVLFLDLDGLKKVNDTLGHNKGDDYLKHFASTLIKHTQNNGSSYRFAGDEFVCIIPKGLQPINLEHFEKEINTEMNKHFQFGGVSIGVSTYPHDGLDPDMLLQVADRNMYGAKNSKKIRSSMNL